MAHFLRSCFTLPSFLVRKHNFYVLSEVSKALDLSDDELIARGIPTYTLTTEEFRQQTQNNVLTNDAQLHHIQTLCQSSKSVTLAPVCIALRRLLGVELANLDD